MGGAARKEDVTGAALHGAETGYDIRVNPDTRGNPELLPIEKLYPLRSVMSPDLDMAMATVGSDLELLNNALAAFECGVLYEVDDQIMRVAATLPDLFLCSSLGEGFAALVIALHYGLTSPREEMWSLDQLQAIRLALRDLKERPFMKHGEALERIIKLEDSGLVVDPSFGEELLPAYE